MNSQFSEYNGFSYEQASREASRIVQQAARTDHWVPIIDRLVELRRIMNEHFDKA